MSGISSDSLQHSWQHKSIAPTKRRSRFAAPGVMEPDECREDWSGSEEDRGREGGKEGGKRWLEGGRARAAKPQRNAEKKKEEFPGDTRIMQPGNSFPRSALFLKASMWETGLSCKGTKGHNIVVIRNGKSKTRTDMLSENSFSRSALYISHRPLENPALLQRRLRTVVKACQSLSRGRCRGKVYNRI